jgi:hypothetical protein
MNTVKEHLLDALDQNFTKVIIIGINTRENGGEGLIMTASSMSSNDVIGALQRSLTSVCYREMKKTEEVSHE